MPSRRPIVGAIAVVVVVVLVVILTRSPAATNIGTSRWTTYSISYRQEFSSSVRFEALSVRRPFEASDLISSGPGTAPAGAISTETALYDVRDTGEVLFVGGREPGPPSGDQDLATQMPEMLARHLASDLHQAQHIAGRTCHTFRLLEPPSGPIKALKGSDHDDICIADGGLVLGERWTIKGNVAYTRRATKVSRHAAALPDVSGATTPSGQNATATSKVVTHPDTFLRTPAAPAGWRAEPVIELAIPSPSGPGALALASYVWSFSRGARTMFVEAGGPSGQLPWRNGDTPTRSVRLAHLGKASTAIRSDGAEIRVALSGGRWVRIRGTLPVHTLERYAQQLRLR